jgi:hypothetical protein
LGFLADLERAGLEPAVERNLGVGLNTILDKCSLWQMQFLFCDRARAEGIIFVTDPDVTVVKPCISSTDSKNLYASSSEIFVGELAASVLN